MLNFYVVRFEDQEVKAGWRHLVSFSKRVVEKTKPVAIAATETAVGLTVASALIGGFGVCKGLEFIANTAADAHDGLHHKLVKLADKYQPIEDTAVVLMAQGVK